MSPRKTKERVFSAHEVANICGVVNQTVINWIDKGHLAAFRTPGGQYRVYPDVLASFFKEQCMRLPEEVQKILAEQSRIDKVLIIDSDKRFVDAVTTVLAEKYSNASVDTASDVFDAGRYISNSPDLIFVATDLAGIDGLGLCQKIRNDRNLTNPIVIAVSSNDVGDDALEAGADAFLKKPIDRNELPELIARLAEERVTRKS